MITQKPVLVKLDVTQLLMLDDLCKKLNINRNKFINFAVSKAVELLSEYDNCLLVSSYKSALKELE